MSYTCVFCKTEADQRLVKQGEGRPSIHLPKDWGTFTTKLPNQPEHSYVCCYACSLFFQATIQYLEKQRTPKVEVEVGDDASG